MEQLNKPNKKRYMPLVNVGLGLLAVGEAIEEYFSGNGEAATHSLIAAGANFMAGIIPYWRYGGEINGSSAILNGGVLLAHNLNKAYNLKNFLGQKPSKSISYNLLTITSMIQIGSNGIEVELKERNDSKGKKVKGET